MQLFSSKPTHRGRRRLRATLWGTVLAGALTLSVVGTRVPTARAEIPIEQIKQLTGVLSTAFGYYGTAIKVLSLLTGEGPSMADLLQKVQQAIVDEIQYWVALELDATATAAFKRYTDILDNPKQTTTNRERVLYLTGSSSSNDAGDLFAEMERLMGDSRNHALSYQLSGPFNTLAVSMGHAYAFHDKYFPEEAKYEWKTYNDHFRRVMNTDFKLVGALKFRCLAAATVQTNLHEMSTLWMHRFAAKPLNVGSMNCFDPIARQSNYYSVDICANRGETKATYTAVVGSKCGFGYTCKNPRDIIVDGKASTEASWASAAIARASPSPRSGSGAASTTTSSSTTRRSAA